RGVVDERALRAQVVVPDVVVDGLVGPADGAVGDVEGDERGGELVFLGTAITAPVVDGGVAHRHVDQPQFVVARGDSPRIGRAGGVDLALGQRAGVAGATQVPGPGQFARLGIPAADDAGGGLAGLAVADLA